jgi:hypothetical protein
VFGESNPHAGSGARDVPGTTHKPRSTPCGPADSSCHRSEDASPSLSAIGTQAIDLICANTRRSQEVRCHLSNREGRIRLLVRHHQELVLAWPLFLEHRRNRSSEPDGLFDGTQRKGTSPVQCRCQIRRMAARTPQGRLRASEIQI